MWINASYASCMICVNDVMQVMCYVLMMLCMSCKLYAMCLWYYASYASVHDASCYDKHWSTMTPWLCKLGVWWYASSCMISMQVWCMIICKFTYDMLCKYDVWLYARDMCKFTP